MPDLCCVIHESNYIQLMHCFSVWHLPAFTVYQVAGTLYCIMTNHFCLVLYDYPCNMDQGVK